MPAASWPSWPFTKITLVDATFSARRSIVANNSTVGKEENSKGLRVLMAIMMISRLAAILKVNKMSSSTGCSGITSMPMIINTNPGMLRSAKLNFDRFCRMADRDRVFIAGRDGFWVGSEWL